MFARYFVELPLPLDEVERALLDHPDEWVPRIAGVADERGEALLAEVGFGDALRVQKRVELEFGAPIRMPSRTILPLRWRAPGGQGRLPALDADLEVAPLGTGATQLSISARYVPPMGVVGRAMDRALLHRVAEATVKDFLDRIADALLALAPPGSVRGA
jgi:hypothetical protein